MRLAGTVQGCKLPQREVCSEEGGGGLGPPREKWVRRACVGPDRVGEEGPSGGGLKDRVGV